MIRDSSHFRFALAPVLLWWLCGSAGHGWPEDVRRGLDRLEARNGDVYQGLAILAGLSFDHDVRTRLHLRLLEHPRRAVKLFALRAMESFPPDGALPAVAGPRRFAAIPWLDVIGEWGHPRLDSIDRMDDADRWRGGGRSSLDLARS